MIETYFRFKRIKNQLYKILRLQRLFLNFKILWTIFEKQIMIRIIQNYSINKNEIQPTATYGPTSLK